MPALLSIQNIECRYQHQAVVQNLSFEVDQGNIIGLLGQSGCGKTTALRAIAGFEPVYKGRILLRSHMVSQPGYMIAPEKRKLGMVFQDYALFPHLTISDNVSFGLRDMDKPARLYRVNELLELVGLENTHQRYPHELSGGQQQRVALARALAPRPEIILMDEPFSNLDVKLRERLSNDVRDILKNQNITGIIVTHDQNEAFAISDLVGVMNNGQIIQWDTPYNLYHEPASRFVAGFIGQGELLRGTLLSEDQIETEIGIISSHKPINGKTGQQMDVLLRPDDLVPDPNGDLVTEVVKKAFKGAEILYNLRLPTGNTLMSLFPSHLNYDIGDRVVVRVDAEHLVAFPV